MRGVPVNNLFPFGLGLYMPQMSWNKGEMKEIPKVLMVVALEETKFPRVIEGQGEDVSTKVGAEIKDLEGSITRFVKPTSESLLKIARLPFYIWWFPHVAFSSLQLASVQTFYSVLSSTTSMIFSAPPYNFNAAQVGYMSAGLCIGATLRILYGGYFTDWAILRLSRRNKGLFEPEMRLYLLPLPAITMTIGLIVNGITTDKASYSTSISTAN